MHFLLLPLLFAQVLPLTSIYFAIFHSSFQEVLSQGKTMSRRRGEESCPFLDGVYVSVMRRFFLQNEVKTLQFNDLSLCQK